MKKSILIILILSLLITSGCWNRKELSEWAIVLAAGVDLTTDGQVRLTLQLARPAAFAGGGAAEGGGGSVSMGQNIVWVVSATGKTIHDAQRNLALQVSRSIYWGHCIIIVYGEEMARHGIRTATNFIHRTPDPRETMWVLVARGEAKKVLESHSEMEKSSAQSIGFLSRTGAGWSVEFKDFIRDLASNGINPVAACVELQRQGEPQGPGMEKVPEHQEPVITGTALFNDERLAGWLDKSETRGLLWLRGKMKKGVVVVPGTKNLKNICFEVARSYTRIEPEYDGEKIRFFVKIVSEVNLAEQQTTENLCTVEAIHALEKKAAREIEDRIKLTLDKAQGEYGVDAFGFGEAFHRKYKKEWKELKDHWNQEFREAEIYLTVEAQIRNTGLQCKRASLRKRE